MSSSNRVAMALITDSNDDVLSGIRNDNGRWTVPGGHLEEGEDAFEGMARELKEETGLDAKKMSIARVTKKGKMLVYVMRVEIDPNQTIDVSKDPDQECDAWMYKDPCDMVDNLHVELEDNTVLQAWMDD